MPKSDSWPGGVTTNPVSGMDSAGSCDSVLSINSAFSDDSLDHLSTEEKACLMFLEETIDSLDVEDDSGLSNDEPDRPSHGLAGRTSHRPSVYHNKPETHEDPNKVIGRDYRPSHKYLVPTPLLVASGNGVLLSRPGELSPKRKSPLSVDAPDGFRLSSDPQHTGPAVLKSAASTKITSAKPSIGHLSEGVDLPPSFIPEPPVRTNMSIDSKAKDSLPQSLYAKSQRKHQNVSSEMTMGWIPPPSDFMDEPTRPRSVVDGPPEWTPELPKTGPSVGSAKPAEVIKPQTTDPVTSRGSLPSNYIENLRQKASMKKAPLTPMLIAQHPGADNPRTPSPSSEHVPALLNEHSEPKTPPPVPPKHKLPSNIILKSHKDTGAAHSLLSQSDRAPKDQQKIRMEALRKLGLLKNDEVDSGPNVSPAQSPSYKSKDLSPVSPKSPSVYPTVPAPDALLDQSRPAGSPVSGDTHLLMDTAKHRDVARSENFLKTPPARPYEIKSASLGRSGVGLSSIVVEPRTPATNLDTTNVELSPGQLRKRPPSVGSAKEFAVSRQVDESFKKLHAASVVSAQAGGDGQKLPRSNGISVVIAPHGKNGENRREALKKLGLLKDGSGR